MPTWCMAPLVMSEGNSLGQGYNRPTGCGAEMAPHATIQLCYVSLCKSQHLAGKCMCKKILKPTEAYTWYDNYCCQILTKMLHYKILLTKCWYNTLSKYICPDKLIHKYLTQWAHHHIALIHIQQVNRYTAGTEPKGSSIFFTWRQPSSGIGHNVVW